MPFEQRVGGEQRGAVMEQLAAELKYRGGKPAFLRHG
jgi:hypothetical protein